MKPAFFFIVSLLLLPLLASCSEQKVYLVYFGEHVTSTASMALQQFSLRMKLPSYLLKTGRSCISVAEPPKEVHHSHNKVMGVVGMEEGEEGNYRKNNQMGGDFLSKAGSGKNNIVGVLDSGVWPESKSFSDVGMGPIPKSWKGICLTGVGFNSFHCNRKLIGARYYLKGFEQYYGPLNVSEDSRSPRDMDGHGTHTSSTVAGRVVPNASALGGFARGYASGGAPLAHIAVYKVCWAIPGQSKAEGNTCFEEDMFAAMDDAIAGAPWIFTVGASSLDRTFLSPVVLGNGLSIEGETVTPSKLEENKKYPLVYAGDVVNPGVAQNLTGQCLAGSLSPEKVKGKIVFCLRGAGMRVSKGLEVKRAGGVGFILGSWNTSTLPKIQRHTKPAPYMTAFTSRGPSVIDPNILKPDITAPGLKILAAWTEAEAPIKLAMDHRVAQYTIESGTSMSCPHIAAAAALLKAIHPTWSSAAIKSALMTTAGMKNNLDKPLNDESGNSATPFAYGAGHFRPTKAADPGLVERVGEESGVDGGLEPRRGPRIQEIRELDEDDFISDDEEEIDDLSFDFESDSEGVQDGYGEEEFEA
ncbi:hypothetical protein ACLB2K_031336 [Fragaria x ananassa]